jgi:hypothetical protein
MSISFFSKSTKVSDQLADLHARCTAQGLEIARLSRELQALKSTAPVTVATQRSGCALVADRLGINERTVRGTLTSHAQFATVRAQLATQARVITRDREFLGWLAENLGSYPR